MAKKIVLGMSGGVDSSVAAKILKDKGYEVIGMFMDCSGGNWPTTIDWEKERDDLKKICKMLKIKLIIKDCAKGYEEKVISKMFEDYSNNLTPNPDILCNNVGKFPLLMKVAKEVGAEKIATGHYARVRKNKDFFEVLMGVDRTKDQSYFLAGLSQDILSKVEFPIGELKKEEVRQIAKKLNFPNWNKRSSRGICYLGKINVKDFLKTRISEKKGPVEDSYGNIVGEHIGSSFFTIGEKVTRKKGVFLKKEFEKKFSQKRLFVLEKKNKNTLVVGTSKDKGFYRKEIFCRKIEICNKTLKEGNIRLGGRIRHLGEIYRGTLLKLENRYAFKTEKKVSGVSKGQYLVLYDSDVVAGFGVIS